LAYVKKNNYRKRIAAIVRYMDASNKKNGYGSGKTDEPPPFDEVLV
jgi:hypothetical protein